MDHRGNSEIDIDFQQLNKPLMIIYGSRSSHVKSIQLDNEACPHCSTHGSVTMSTFTRYAHVFWIPFFHSVVLACRTVSIASKRLLLKKCQPRYALTISGIWRKPGCLCGSLPAWPYSQSESGSVSLPTTSIRKSRRSA